MIRGMVFRIIKDDAIVDVQRRAEMGFDFEFLGLHFSHEYNRRGDESIKVQDEKGLYERVDVMMDGEPVEHINDVIELNNARVVFNCIYFDTWTWIIDSDGYQVWSKCFE